MTNADRIKNMNNDEFSFSCDSCYEKINCDICFKDWLDSEV